MAICGRYHGHMVVMSSIQNGINPQIDAVFVSSRQSMACAFFPLQSFFTNKNCALISHTIQTFLPHRQTVSASVHPAFRDDASPMPSNSV